MEDTANTHFTSLTPKPLFLVYVLSFLWVCSFTKSQRNVHEVTDCWRYICATQRYDLNSVELLFHQRDRFKTSARSNKNPVLISGIWSNLSLLPFSMLACHRWWESIVSVKECIFRILWVFQGPSSSGNFKGVFICQKLQLLLLIKTCKETTGPQRLLSIVKFKTIKSGPRRCSRVIFWLTFPTIKAIKKLLKLDLHGY